VKKDSVVSGPARFSRGARAFYARLAAWRWGGPLARVALGAAGLVLLAVIGRSALAGSPSPSAPPPAAPPASGAPAPPAMPQGSSVPQAAPEPLPAPPPSGSAAPGDTGVLAHSKRATPDDPVYLNQATFEDLRRLPGIGPKRAEAVLALRQRLGRFKQVEDLMRVKGIGRATLRKLRPLVRLDAAGPLNPGAPP
jgi:competence protein ComEA